MKYPSFYKPVQTEFAVLVHEPVSCLPAGQEAVQGIHGSASDEALNVVATHVTHIGLPIVVQEPVK